MLREMLAMDYEIELKLSINKADARKLRQVLVLDHLALNNPAKHKITSIYFDTRDLQLLDAGITLRLRHKARDWIQTIKLAGTANSGLHQRCEWEDLVRSGHPDYTKIKSPKLIRFFADQKLRASLIPIFQTEIMRTEWLLTFENVDKVELSLDLGMLRANQCQEPINEIELELKAGNVGRIFDLALELQKSIPLKIENASKAKRGYAYYRPSAPQIFKSKFPNLDSNIDVNAAFKKITLECISHLEGNQDIVLIESDVEGIHQMRVALRRLRSAFTLFKNLINSEESRFLLTEVNWLKDTLGKVRDLDVFITETLPMVTESSINHNGFFKLKGQALQARLLASQEMQEALMSQRYHKLLLMLSSWLENERWLGQQNMAKNYKLHTIAKKSLSKFYKRLLQSKLQFKDMKPEYRHAVRITAKKLRYASEFFYGLYSSKEAGPFIKKLAKLQDSLGKLNDIIVTENFLMSISGSMPNAIDKDVKLAFANWSRKKTDQEISRVDSSLKKLLEVKPFWIDNKK
jgi:inorganic triphosphatase YgiF